jgi:GNAT superfamily N-acetyltransferase
MQAVIIGRIGGDAADVDVRGLAELLVDSVEGGAGVSFLSLTVPEAEGWWRSVLAALSPRAVVLVARERDDCGRIVGTVQLQPAWAPNQPHRADIAKLLVHRRARRRGIAHALMAAVEQAAVRNGFTLLLLDTCKGYDAERLYASTGWVRVGEVPGFALNPDGSICDTVFFYKSLDAAAESGRTR